MIEDEDDAEKSLDEKMFEIYGSRTDWENDVGESTIGFSNAYKEFLRNGCRGVLTYEEAVEEYKTIAGQTPESVTSWPELDWVKQQREEVAEKEEFIRVIFGLSLDEFRALHFPYEPMLRNAY